MVNINNNSNICGYWESTTKIIHSSKFKPPRVFSIKIVLYVPRKM